MLAAASKLTELKLASIAANDFARKYHVEDLRGASVPGSRRRPILEQIDAWRPITQLQMIFLEHCELHALYGLASGVRDFNAFSAETWVEQHARIKAADAKSQAVFAGRLNDPELRRKREVHELRKRYGLGYIDS